MEPQISVVMPAYNSKDYIAEAIDSILNQTFKNFEFIIINDGSTDNTGEIIKEYEKKDDRIVYLENEENRKISYTRNRGMENAKGPYIAFMDSDDISLPERLQKQIKYMEENPECGIVSSFVEDDDKTDNPRPTDDHDLKLHLLYGSPFSASGAMIKKSFFDEHDLKFNAEYEGVQDFELWSRAKRFMKFHVLPECLLKRGAREKNITVQTKRIKMMLSNKIYVAAFKEIIDEDFYVPLFTKFEFTLEELKESLNVLGEMPLLKLKPDAPFTRAEISHACDMNMKNLMDMINLPNTY